MRKEAFLRVMSVVFIFNFFSIALMSSVSGTDDNIYIRADGSIDPPTAPIHSDGNVYTLTSDIYNKTVIVEKDDVVIDGNWHTIRGTGIHLSKGLDLSNIEGVTVKNMVITGFYYGILLNSSKHNTISGNTFLANTYGIYVSTLSRSNRVFHNSFFNPTNIIRALVTWHDGYPSGGNFWYFYNNEDFYSGPSQDVIGSDGIGDWIYNIDEDNFDSYPLMGPYSIFNFTSQEETQYIDALSNSTISSFTYDPTDHTISFYVYGSSETLGFCRICIPHALIEEPTVLVNDQNPLYVNPILHDNGTHRWIYFSYEHSKHVTIVPAHLLTDLNNDGIVNILDVTIVATAFGTKPEDERWNETADLDKNGVINILDVAIVARDYGKTVA